MPCYDCMHWNRPMQWAERSRAGFCRLDRRSSHSNYHCRSWRQREVTPTEVGLTPAEVDWAREHPTDPHVKELSTMYRHIQFQPNDSQVRADFFKRLEVWREHRARTGVNLFAPPE
jgi:hypothetical protein